MMAKMNRISVVVLCRNQSANLIRILRCLSKQTLKPCEVVVADDSSTQPIEYIAERNGCKYVRTLSGPRAPFAGRRALARQLGTLSAKGDIILYLDGDILLPHHLLEGLELQHYTQRGAVVKVPRLYRITLDNKVIKNPACPDSGARSNRHIPFDRFTSDCFSVERNTIMDLGGWDTNFLGWGEEDVELAYRLQLASVRITSPHSSRLYCTHIDHPVDHQQNFLSLQRNAHYFKQKFNEIGIIRSHAWGAIETYYAFYYGYCGATTGY